jgi:hypothetical protein
MPDGREFFMGLAERLQDMCLYTGDFRRWRLTMPAVTSD